MSAENPFTEKPPVPSPIEQKESQETIPLNTEDLLSLFDQLHESSMEAKLDSSEREKVYQTLHGMAEHFENQKMFTSYEAGTVPTFTSMEKAVAIVDAHLAVDEGDPDLDRLRKLLSQRITEIRRWCSRYEQSIVVFHRKRKHMLHKSEEGVGKEFERADQERRRIHENLMEALRSLDVVILQVNEREPLEQKIPRWDPFNTVPENFANTNPFIFSAKSVMHENRDLIRDWALVANLEQKLEAQRAYFSQENAAE